MNNDYSQSETFDAPDDHAEAGCAQSHQPKDHHELAGKP